MSGERRPYTIDRNLFPPALLAALEGITLPLFAIPQHSVGGAHHTRRIGDSIEFIDIRPYVSGDDVRSVDWSVYRRFRRLYVRRYESERSRDLLILLDTSASMGTPDSKFRCAQTLAGVVATIAGRANDRVAVLPFSDRLGVRGAGRTRGGIPVELLAYISQLRPGGGTHIGPAVRETGSKRPRGSALVLITDCLDGGGLAEALPAVRARGLELLVYHCLAPSDVAPPRRGVHRLVDVETGASRVLTVDRTVAREFETIAERWRGEIRRDVESVGGRYIYVRTDRPLIETVRRAG